MGVMSWMVYESMAGEPPAKRRRGGRGGPAPQGPGGPGGFVPDNSPPGPDVLARVAIKVSEDGTKQIFLDIKHQVGDEEGIRADVHSFMSKHGVPEEYRDQLFKAAQEALRQTTAQQAGQGMPGGEGGVPENWADQHVEEQEDDTPEEEEVE